MKTKVVKLNAAHPLRRHLQDAATILRQGGLVAFPTETVYGLGADALNAVAVEKIFTAKGRPGWDPLIVHVRNETMAEQLAAELPATFWKLAENFWPGPLTMVVKKSDAVPDAVTAGRPTVAMRMPRHPVAAGLLAEAGLPIAAPSANRFGRLSTTRAEHVLEELPTGVDMILDAGPSPVGVESTVVNLTGSTPTILRPGGVTREQLEAILGPVTLAPAVADEQARQGLTGPGMTLSHYAPQAHLELFDGDLEAVTNQLLARAIELRQRNRRVGAIVATEMLPAVEKVTELVAAFGAWGDWEKLASRLFAALRVMDQQGVVTVLCVLPPPVGMGLAVRDRLLRAAGKSGSYAG